MLSLLFMILIGYAVYTFVRRNPHLFEMRGMEFGEDGEVTERPERRKATPQPRPKLAAPDDDPEFLAWIEQRLKRGRDEGKNTF